MTVRSTRRKMVTREPDKLRDVYKRQVIGNEIEMCREALKQSREGARILLPVIEPV